MDSGEEKQVEELLTAARRGCGNSMGALLELYRNYLDLFARSQITRAPRVRVNPSDLVQETFLKACRHFPKFRGSSKAELLAWLRRILINELLRTGRRPVLPPLGARPGEEPRPHSLDEATCHDSSVSAQAQRHELAAELAAQIALLPADYREVLILRNFEGLPFQDVARRMGRSPGAVRILWVRALARLREQHRGKERV
jgi:RNA polymerase sigma-70 factor (ECF subfamily)